MIVGDRTIRLSTGGGIAAAQDRYHMIAANGSVPAGNRQLETGTAAHHNGGQSIFPACR